MADKKIPPYIQEAIEDMNTAQKEAKRPLEDRAFDYIEPLLEAERGDFRRVADLIERREWLPDNILVLVAEHLRGNAPAPERRTRQQMKLEQSVCFQVEELMKADAVGNMRSQSEAIEIVAKERHKSPEAIRGYLANMKNGK